MLNRNGEEITKQEILDEIRWVSNDPETVSVSQDGVLSANKVGQTTIVAYHCDLGEELIVLVELDPVPCIFKALDMKGTYVGRLSFKHKKQHIMEPRLFSLINHILPFRFNLILILFPDPSTLPIASYLESWDSMIDWMAGVSMNT